MGGAHDDPLAAKAAALRRKRFIATWFKNPQGVTTYVCLALGALCVFTITRYHFVQSNYINIDKRKRSDIWTRPYSHIMPQSWIDKNNIYVEAGKLTPEGTITHFPGMYRSAEKK